MADTSTTVGSATNSRNLSSEFIATVFLVAVGALYCASWFLEMSAAFRSEKRIEHAHVHDRVVQAACIWRFLAHGVRERLGLQLVLVGHRQDDLARAAGIECRRVGDPVAARPIRRRVERDLDLDAAGRADEVDALAARGLRRRGR